jgi:hypothetical protein
MAAFDRSRTRWKYTTDTAIEYSFNALTGYTSQAAVLGGSAAAAGLRPHPRGFKPRVALCWLAADHSKKRRVVVYDNTATAYTTIGTAVMVDVGGTATEYIVYETEGERHRSLGSLA